MSQVATLPPTDEMFNVEPLEFLSVNFLFPAVTARSSSSSSPPSQQISLSAPPTHRRSICLVDRNPYFSHLRYHFLIDPLLLPPLAHVPVQNRHRQNLLLHATAGLSARTRTRRRPSCSYSIYRRSRRRSSEGVPSLRGRNVEGKTACALRSG